MTSPRILIAEVTGQLGWELAWTLAPLGEMVAPGRGTLDLSDVEQVRRVVRGVAPSGNVSVGGGASLTSPLLTIRLVQRDEGGLHSLKTVGM